MSYFRKGRRGLSGLGGVENCGPDQVWDPNVEFYGIKGQCMPRKNYSASQLENPNAIPGVVKTAGASSGPSTAQNVISSILGVLTAPAAAPVAPVYYPPAQSGMSSTTKLALAAGGALLLVAVIASRD